jgi:K+-transporting ATPase ATPase A chain
MTATGWFQIVVFLIAILAVTPLLGRYMTRVFNRDRTWLDPVLRPIERVIYRTTGVDEMHEMRWTEYAFAMLAFSAVSMIMLYLIQRTQQWLPWNPQHFPAFRRRSPSTPPPRSRQTQTGRRTRAKPP